MSRQRLDKLLSNSGYGSRKEIKKLVKDGVVKVDGIPANDPSMHVETEKQEIEIFGMRLDYKKFIYLIMNKPNGVVSATYDNKYKTVLDLVPQEYRHFEPFPVGRLDIDTEGLLLLTNDGQLAHDLLAPKRHVPKTYYALIDGEVNEQDIQDFKEGITLDDGYKTLPADLNILKSSYTSEIELTIFEGKFHQVKRMFEAAGKTVKFLKRLKMGPLTLEDDLISGETRELTDEELKKILSFKRKVD